MLFSYRDVPEEFYDNFTEVNGNAYWKFPSVEDTFDFLVDAIETEGFDEAMQNYMQYPIRLGLFLHLSPPYDELYHQSHTFLKVLNGSGYDVDEGGNVQLPFSKYKVLYDLSQQIESQPNLEDVMGKTGKVYADIYKYLNE
jgi:hypothetical protein